MGKYWQLHRSPAGTGDSGVCAGLALARARCLKIIISFKNKL